MIMKPIGKNREFSEYLTGHGKFLRDLPVSRGEWYGKYSRGNREVILEFRGADWKIRKVKPGVLSLEPTAKFERTRRYQAMKAVFDELAEAWSKYNAQHPIS